MPATGIRTSSSASCGSAPPDLVAATTATAVAVAAATATPAALEVVVVLRAVVTLDGPGGPDGPAALLLTGPGRPGPAGRRPCPGGPGRSPRSWSSPRSRRSPRSRPRSRRSRRRPSPPSPASPCGLRLRGRLGLRLALRLGGDRLGAAGPGLGGGAATTALGGRVLSPTLGFARREGPPAGWPGISICCWATALRPRRGPRTSRPPSSRRRAASSPVRALEVARRFGLVSAGGLGLAPERRPHPPAPP